MNRIVRIGMRDVSPYSQGVLRMSHAGPSCLSSGTTVPKEVQTHRFAAPRVAIISQNLPIYVRRG